MEIKPSWFYLCVTLLSISFHTGSSSLWSDGGWFKDNAQLEYNETERNNVMAEILDRKLEPFSELMSDFHDTIVVKLEAVTALQYDLNKKIKEVTDNKLSEQPAGINKHVTDKTHATREDAHILELFEKINFRLTTMEINLKNQITEKFDKLETNRNKEMKEIADKLHLLTKNTQELNEKMDLSHRGTTVPESIETTSIRPAEVVTDLNQPNRTYEIVKNYSRASKSDGSMMSPFCELSVPSSVQVAASRWQHNPGPRDELDTFLANATGCTYKALGCTEDFSLPTVTFDGTLFEWHGAIRAAESGDIVVRWADHAGYAFYIGVDGNQETIMYQRRPWRTIQRLLTPDVLSADRYVPFYIRIHAGTLTFWRACEREPLFSRIVYLERGQHIYMEFYPFSRSGGKHLYNCPARVAVP